MILEKKKKNHFCIMNLHIICATFKEQCLYMYLFVNFCTDLWFLYAKKFIKKKKNQQNLYQI